MGLRPTPRSRAALALMACVLWLAGVEILPNLHLARHADDHTHDASGMVVRVSLTTQSHRHADGEVHAGAPHGDAAKRLPQNRGMAQLADGGKVPHAADGLAHRAVALDQPAPPITRPVPVEQPLAWIIVTTTTDRIVDRELASPSARGPPIA